MTNLHPLDPSPIGLPVRRQPGILDEILEYGTDTDCRRALYYVAEVLGGQGIETMLADADDAKAELDQAETKLKEYQEFFSDTVSLVEEYGGLYPCAEPYNIAPIVADTFREHDDMRTVLANIRQAIADGESAEYIASLLG